MKKEETKNNTEYAIFEFDSKQHNVNVGDVVALEGHNSRKVGDKMSFDKVLLVTSGPDTTIGTPYIKGANVSGKVLSIEKGRKLSVIRFRAKSRHRRKIGHRDHITKVEITQIS